MIRIFFISNNEIVVYINKLKYFTVKFLLIYKIYLLNHNQEFVIAGLDSGNSMRSINSCQ